jgi:hypothetical protein
MWSARFDASNVSDGDHRIKVKVTGAGGDTNEDAITVTVNQSGSFLQVQRPFGPVGNSVGAYTEKGLLGTHTTKSGHSTNDTKGRKH